MEHPVQRTLKTYHSTRSLMPRLGAPVVFSGPYVAVKSRFIAIARCHELPTLKQPDRPHRSVVGADGIEAPD